MNGQLHPPFALSPVKEGLFKCWSRGRLNPRTGLYVTTRGNKPRFSIPWSVTSLAENPFIINKALFIFIYLFKGTAIIFDRIHSYDCGVLNSELERMGKEAILTYVAFVLLFAWNEGENQVSRSRFKSGTLPSSNISPQRTFLC